jgi:Enoyl-CoA hydratase/isomerase
MSDVVRYEVNGPVATITLNRPDKRNALNTEAVLELDRRIVEAGPDESVKVVLIAGSGRAFSAGFDINDEIEDGTETPLDWHPVLRRDVEVTTRVWRAPNRPWRSCRDTAWRGAARSLWPAISSLPPKTRCSVSRRSSTAPVRSARPFREQCRQPIVPSRCFISRWDSPTRKCCASTSRAPRVALLQ